MTTDNQYMQFFNKVKHVRSLQKQYFSTKSKAILISAQTEERELDQMILKIGQKLEKKGGNTHA